MQSPKLKKLLKVIHGFAEGLTSTSPTIQGTVQEKLSPGKAKQKVHVGPTLCVLHIRVPPVLHSERQQA